MENITIEISSVNKIWEVINQQFNYLYIYKFNFVNAEIKTANTILHQTLNASNFNIENISIDINTDLQGVKRILKTDPEHIYIYQFDCEIPKGLEFAKEPKNTNLDKLIKNGLKAIYICNHEFLTIYSSNLTFLNEIYNQSRFEENLNQLKLTLDIK